MRIESEDYLGETRQSNGQSHGVTSGTTQRLCNDIFQVAQQQMRCTTPAAIIGHQIQIRLLNIAILQDHLNRWIRDPVCIERAKKTIAHLRALNAAHEPKDGPGAVGFCDG